MNAVDIPARGLARRAVDFIDLADQGSASLAARSEPTAAALEQLTTNHGALTGYAGSVHTVEYPPYLTRPNLVIRGNGAELRNTDTWDISDTDIISVALPLGSSNITATSNLTDHAILPDGTAGAALNLGDDAANYAPGDLVVLHGSTNYQTWVYDAYRKVYRHYVRAKVVSVEGGFVTIDRAPSPELLADAPQIGNTAEGVDCGFGDGPDAFYLLYNPSVSNITLSSAVGDAWKWGGIIDGRFRDITVEGRSALEFNALQDCLFDGIRFLGWRKIAEMAEGSVGSVYRNVRGTLLSNAGKFGSGDDVAPFFIAFTENCRDCTMEDFIVSSGPNTATAEAVLIAAGRGNRLRASKLSFPAHTNLAVLISSSDTAGIDLVDSGMEDCEIAAPNCSTFLALYPGAAGMVRPFVRDTRFFGNPSTGVAAQVGYPGRVLTGAVLDNVTFENGSLAFNGSVTDCTIRDCYLPGGFTNLTPAILGANNIRDNDSNANRAARAAAYTEQGLNQTTATAANTIYAKAAFPTGSLAPGDRIHVFVDATSGDANAKIARLSATHGSVPTITAIGANTRGAAGGMCIQAEIQVVSDTVISYRTDLWGTVSESFVSVGSIATNGLAINLELWTASSASPIGVRAVRIIPVKPGMTHLPVR